MKIFWSMLDTLLHRLSCHLVITTIFLVRLGFSFKMAKLLRSPLPYLLLCGLLNSTKLCYLLAADLVFMRAILFHRWSFIPCCSILNYYFHDLANLFQYFLLFPHFLTTLGYQILSQSYLGCTSDFNEALKKTCSYFRLQNWFDSFKAGIDYSWDLEHHLLQNYWIILDH